MGPGAAAQRTNIADRLSATIPITSAMYGKNLFGIGKLYPDPVMFQT